MKFSEKQKEQIISYYGSCSLSELIEIQKRLEFAIGYWKKQMRLEG
jgi:hypothetical protein